MKRTAARQRVVAMLDEDAAQLLGQMAPTGRYGRTLSRLIRAEAARQGLTPESEDDLLDQVQELLARIRALRRAHSPAQAQGDTAQPGEQPEAR